MDSDLDERESLLASLASGESSRARRLELRPMWRNEPIPVPRLSSVPRGGTILTDARSPLPSFESLFATFADNGDHTTWTFVQRPFDNDDDSESPLPSRVRGGLGAGGGDSTPNPNPTSNTNPISTSTTTSTAPMTTGELGGGGGGGRLGGRSREETNSLAGRALRSKKGVYLVYCGARRRRHYAGRGDDDDPSSSSPSRLQSRRGGCGALLCARGLVEGVPKKVFVDDDDNDEGSRNRVELAGFSSDLPPSTTGVGDLFDHEHGLGERVGKRGWKGCKACVTRDLGCRKCGNHVGYRLLRPDVFCSIARQSASFPQHAGPWRRVDTLDGGPSAGGVTGGGVVDGLLFHYRGDRTTSVRRRVGISPPREINLDEEEDDDDDDERYEEGNPAGRRRARVGQEPDPPLNNRRLRERAPTLGEDMVWKHIPTPQRDFRDGLVAEPLDWLTPNQETWWLDHAIAKHSYAIHGGRRKTGTDSRRFANRKHRLDSSQPREEDFSTDTLSSAATTTTTTTMTIATTPAADPTPRTSSSSSSQQTFGSGSLLSRSPAIRLRVPLASSSSSSSSTGASSVDTYDRYRRDAETYNRRVRQRLSSSGGTASRGDDVIGVGGGGGGGGGGGATNDHAAGAGIGVIASLERAGYGSWYDDDDDDDDDDEALEDAEEEECERDDEHLVLSPSRRGGGKRKRARVRSSNQSVGR